MALFNFCIDSEEDGARFGVCSADSIEQAEEYIRGSAYIKEGESLNIEYGAEDLINEEYGGVAFLTTEG